MTSVNNKRIAVNTLMLYFRQVLILIVGLYTVRVVLDVLGVEDFGIYNVINGIVAFFSFLSGTLASATQRFFSFAIGEGDLQKLKKTFTSNYLIYGVIALIGFLLLETLGSWFINEHLNVPEDRFEAAKFVFHFSALSFVATIIVTPFMAIIIAHEDMKIYAYVSILEAVLKLISVISLIYIPGEKLELYSVIFFSVTTFTTMIYIAICMYKYEECQFRKFYWDRSLLKEILQFTGWTLFGQISNVARIQSVTILLNQFFNPTVVASRAIAMNITSKVKLFSNNFNVGLYPPIIKSYAAGNKLETYSLIFNGSKITFFLMWFFTLPMLLEMNAILLLWLKEVPYEADLFTRLALVEVVINSLSLPMATAARAPGKMRSYELTLGTIQILIFITCWVVLHFEYPAHSVFVVAIVANVVMFVIRLFIVNRLVGLPILPFFRVVVVPVLIIVLLSGVPSYLVKQYIPSGFVYSVFTIFTSMFLAIVSMYFFGLNKEWKERIRKKIGEKLTMINLQK